MPILPLGWPASTSLEEAAIRILLAMPHFFSGATGNAPNRSGQPGAEMERLRALVMTICAAHQTLGQEAYGLDHERRRAVAQAKPDGYTLDLVICTSGGHHLLNRLPELSELYRHHATDAEPRLLGFEAHKVLAEAQGRYDYYGFIEDDLVILDPLFFKKRAAFDRQFGAQALLQPQRYEVSPQGPVRKLYVDYRMPPQQTQPYQNLADQPSLELPFLDETIRFERSSYPSSGCFFLSAAQLAHWVKSPAFLDGDVSYLGPLDSAATLSVMKSFRIYKPVLDQAWFLEVMHASPRWILNIRNHAVIG